MLVDNQCRLPSCEHSHLLLAIPPAYLHQRTHRKKHDSGMGQINRAALSLKGCCTQTGLGCFPGRSRQRCLLRSTRRDHACLSILRQDLAPEAEVPQAGFLLLERQGHLQCCLQEPPGEVKQVSCICMQSTRLAHAPAAQVTEPIRMVQALALSMRSCPVRGPLLEVWNN